jgi:hypothetical protein
VGAFTDFDRIRDGKRWRHAGALWYDGLVHEMIRSGPDFLAASLNLGLEKRSDGYPGGGERPAAARRWRSNGRARIEKTVGCGNSQKIGPPRLFT